MFYRSLGLAKNGVSIILDNPLHLGKHIPKSKFNLEKILWDKIAAHTESLSGYFIR